MSQCILWPHSVTYPQNAVDNVRIVLVGNKIDLENQREVSEKRGRKVCYTQHGLFTLHKLFLH